MFSPSDPLHRLLPLLLTERSPAWILCDAQGRVLSWDGALAAHGIDHLEKGKKAEEQIDFLSGLLPLDNTPLHLPCVQTGDERFSEVYAARDAEGDRIFLLDITQAQIAQRDLLQKANELALLREQLGQTADES